MDGWIVRYRGKVKCVSPVRPTRNAPSAAQRSTEPAPAPLRPAPATENTMSAKPGAAVPGVAARSGAKARHVKAHCSGTPKQVEVSDRLAIVEAKVERLELF